MTMEECYAALGGDYDAISRRLGKEDRIRRFLGLFLRDENFPLLEESVAGEDWETAFRAAHSLKGVALNLAFTDLAQSSSDLTEALRGGAPSQDPAPLVERVRADYRRAVDAIHALPAV